MSQSLFDFPLYIIVVIIAVGVVVLQIACQHKILSPFLIEVEACINSIKKETWKGHAHDNVLLCIISLCPTSKMIKYMIQFVDRGMLYGISLCMRHLMQWENLKRPYKMISWRKIMILKYIIILNTNSYIINISICHNSW